MARPAGSPERSKSIKQTLKSSYIIIICLMLTAPIVSISFSLYQTIRYDRMITNVSRTNRLNQIVKTDVANELWDIVAGSKGFAEGRQFEILEDISRRLNEILRNTQVTESRQLLEVADRAVNTLSQYVRRLGLQIQNNFLVEENELILDEIRGVSDLISDILQDFIVLEIEAAAHTNEDMKKIAVILSLIQLVILAFVMSFSIFTQRTLTLSINKPINELVTLSSEIALGNLTARAAPPHLQELDHLTENLNIMAYKIKGLIETNVEEQKNRQKSEMKALQAQITPHFLYNTLDTIVWLAEGGQNDKVINVTRNFSNFFRASLNKGNEWISVKEEFDHVANYLSIQKVRYNDILDYSIDYDPSMEDKTMLKILLQPLVENALYHGIKNKRGRGKLKVTGSRKDGILSFTVEDNGIGMESERLEQLKQQIASNSEGPEKGEGYGLYNVNKRLKLYYNVRLEVESVYREGTCVSFSIPEM